MIAGVNGRGKHKIQYNNYKMSECVYGEESSTNSTKFAFVFTDSE